MESKNDKIISQFNQSFLESHDHYLESFEKFYPRICRTVDLFEKLLGIPRSRQNIVDLACGTGPIAIELSKRGHNVTAVDITPAAIDIAKEVALMQKVDVFWELSDIKDSRWSSQKDFILLWDVIFPIFDRTEGELIIENVAHSLKRNGKFLLETYNKSFAIEHGIEKKYFYDHKKDLFIAIDAPINEIMLYTEEELLAIFTKYGLSGARVDGWGYPNDAKQCADYYVAEKL